MVRVLNHLKSRRGTPKFLFCDNGSEFTGQAMDLWAQQNHVRIDFSSSGIPGWRQLAKSFPLPDGRRPPPLSNSGPVGSRV